MSVDQTQSAAPSVEAPHAPIVSLGWVLRRVVFGVTVLTVFMGGTAWMMHASINPADAETPFASWQKPPVSDASAAPDQASADPLRAIESTVGRFAVKAAEGASIAP